MVPPKWLRMTWNSQFRPIHNFSNLFPPKWLRMTRSGQFHPIHNFSHQSGSEWFGTAKFAWFATFPIFSHQMIDWSIQQGEGGGGGKWPNANCEHQTTKWKYPNLPTTNDQFGEGEVNDQMQIVNTKLPNENIQTYQPQMIDSLGEGVNDQTHCEHQTTKWKYPNLPTPKWLIPEGEGVNDQMQIVNTKLPTEKIQTYQPQMIDSVGGGGCKWPNANCGQTTKWEYPNIPTTNDRFWGGVNYQMQIVIKLPIVPPKCLRMTWNSQFWPIHNFSNLFPQVAQNDSERPISPDSQLFQSFPTKVAQNDLEQPNLPDLQLSQSFPTEVALKMTWTANFAWFATFPIFSHWSGSEWPISPDSLLCQSLPTGVTQKMANFAWFATFPIFSHQMIDWSLLQGEGGGGGGKWPNANCEHQTTNEISKPTNYKWLIPGGRGKWPNANCGHQTTNWKYPNLPTTNDQLWGGGVNDQMQIVNTKLPNKNIQTYQPQMINSLGEGVNDQTHCEHQLPNENIQTYQPQMTQFWGGG